VDRKQKLKQTDVLYEIEFLLKDKIKGLTNKWVHGNRGAMVRVALVGYTNVKSTLMNAMGKVMFLSKTSFLPLWIPKFEK
jgi:50S ribosomal subunit-associated GTPase HflX